MTRRLPSYTGFTVTLILLTALLYQNCSPYEAAHTQLESQSENRSNTCPAATTVTSEWSLAVENMKPGEWKELSATYIIDGREVEPEPFFISNTNSDRHLNFADSAVWDPFSKCVYFYGSGHLSHPVNIQYCEETNTLRQLQLPPYIQDEIDFQADGGVGTPYDYTGHGYDRNAIDPINSYMYRFMRKKIFRFDTRNLKWEEIDAPLEGLQGGARGFATGSAYFPGLGLALLVPRLGAVYLWNQEQGWTKFSDAPIDNDYHTVAEYNPVHDVMAVGGGNGIAHLWLIDRTGAYERMPDAPIPIQCTGASGGHDGTWLTVDPVSGDFLLLGPDGSLYALTKRSGSWEWINTGTPAPFGQVTKAAAAAIGDHGVILYMRAYAPHIWLYKHSSGQGPPTDPAPREGEDRSEPPACNG